MTAAVNLRVISVLMHIETMQLYQAHYVGCVKHEEYRTEYAVISNDQLNYRRRVFRHGWPCDYHMHVLCMQTAKVTVSGRIRFITRLAICSYYTVMHSGSRVHSIIHDNCLMLCISAEMISNNFSH